LKLHFRVVFCVYCLRLLRIFDKNIVIVSNVVVFSLPKLNDERRYRNVKLGGKKEGGNEEAKA